MKRNSSRYQGVAMYLSITRLVLAVLFSGTAVLSQESGGDAIDREPNPAEERTFVGMKFVWIPPGTFTMGSSASEEGHQDDEAPQHQVTIIRGFWMGKFEVTQAQWVAVMDSNPSHFKGDNLPVESLTRYGYQQFIRKLNQRGEGKFRLPTEAEWEYACRAGTTTPFHFGTTISTGVANYNGTFAYGDGSKGVYRERTVAVGTFPPNIWGLYDMHGNVAEWCQDWYGPYSTRSITDPNGPSSGDRRVLRGGDWETLPNCCRSAFRCDATDYSSASYGIRLVREED